MVRAAPALLLALGGCFLAETFRPLSASSSGWYEVGPIRKPLEEIMEAARTYLVRAGYVLGRPDPADRAFETEWDTHLSSHWREGFRTKVEVEFPEQADGSTLVRIRSYREVNNEQVSPMMETKARWVGASTDDKQAPLIPEPAIRLRQQLKVRFFGLTE
jgi:uncharacterized lipoprotein